ncbi:MAG: hypothetical protein MUE46_14900 [Xanthomonadales bacterium]|jgi:hypothetical protein|nr:hypothetical protein [Xanthomonadales bacterium]
MRITVDKIASSSRNLKLSRTLTLTENIRCEEGAVLAVRVIGDKSTYNQLEDNHGRWMTLHDGDLVVGVLGKRHALHGYEGVMPDRLTVGDRLNMLNIGGVMGRCVSYNRDVGPPFELEVLGQVLVFPEFGSRQGVPAHVRMNAIQGSSDPIKVPVVYIVGTCMNAGKTLAGCAIVRALHAAGLKVGGAKLTGISLMRDVLSLYDHGAEVIADFTDAGVICSDPAHAAKTARIVLSEIAARGVDVIVAETGDGILGEYGVQAILADAELRSLSKAIIFCANDPVGVAGGARELMESYGLKIDVVAGPATDNRVGNRFIERLGLVAHNAKTDPRGLGDRVLKLVRGG